MAIKLVKEQDKLTLGTPIIAGGGGSGAPGEDGGYYIPTVDAEGNLSWTPSEADMPGVDTVNIKGEPGYTPIKGVDYFDGEPGAPGYTPIKNVDYFDGADGKDGADGEPGVYVGSSAPTDDSLIWINPEGEPEKYATEQYVTDAIAAIDIPESSGDGIKTLIFTVGSYSSAIPHKEELEAIKASDIDDIASKYRIIIKNENNRWIECTEFFTAGRTFTARGSFNAEEKYWCMLYAYYRDGELTSLTATLNALADEGGSGDGWQTTDEPYGDNIYNAKEIFIRMQTVENSKWIFSHFICNPVFEETIGNAYQNTNIAFATPDGMDNSTPYWNYDGYNLNITCDGGYSNLLIAYKH